MEFAIIMSIFTVMMAGLVIHGQAVDARRREAFEQLAGEHGGRLLTDQSWFSGLPHVRHRYRDRILDVRQTSTGGKHPTFYIEISMEFRGDNPMGFRAEVYPERFFSSLGKLLGMEDLVIGKPGFDDRYILKSNDHDRLKDLLDDTVRGGIDAMYGLFRNHDVYVHVDRGRVLVKKQRIVQSFADLEGVHGLALLVFDGVLRALRSERLLPGRAASGAGSAGIRFLPGPGAASGGGLFGPVGPTGWAASPRAAPARGPPEGVHFLPDRTGIHFLGEDEPAPPPPSMCLVCGDELAGRVNVRCTSCSTEHHRDCWEYNDDRCSTYGCSSRYSTEA